MPIKQASQNKKICDLHISNIVDEQQKFYQLLHHTYSKAPFYPSVMKVLDGCFSEDKQRLSDFLAETLLSIIEYLDISVRIVRSSELTLPIDIKGQDRILAIAELLGASTYVNSIGGKTLYSCSEFKKRGLDLLFLKYEQRKYQQFSKQFSPNLSILDGLMFNSPNEMRDMIKRYELIDG